MEEPIRYAYGDPIEKWLFDVLLLDAEPVELTEEDYELIKRKEVYLEEPDLDDWFENDRKTSGTSLASTFWLTTATDRATWPY